MTRASARFLEYPLSRLANGVKVVTSPYPCHFAGIGAYLKAGSRFEPPLLSGMSHISDRLSFKATKRFTQEEMEQRLLALGGNYQCESSRETMIYQASTFTKDIAQMAELIAATVTEPLILPEEVAEQVVNTEYELDSVAKNPDALLPELAHQAAFADGLGNPLLVSKDKLLLTTPAMVWQYRHAMYRPDRLTLAFVGVPHEQSLELAERYFGSFAVPEGSPELATARSTYVAGERCVPLPPPVGAQPQFYHCHILFRAPGVNHADVYACATLQTLLGGGGSFSAGGPGKGMYSRLYTQVLNQYGYIESCVAVNHTYSDDGLFGIACSALPAAAKYMPYVVCAQLAALFTPNAVSAVEVERAKNQLCSQLLMNLESRVVEMEDAGRQVEMNGRKMGVHEMVARIEALTVKDLQRAARSILTQSEPTIVLMGEREAFGDVRRVCKEFGLGVKGA